MRRVLIALVVVTIAALAVAGTAGGDRTGLGVSVPRRLTVRVPPGWQVLHGWLSDVTDPAPRLVVASFGARLSRHTCECGFPNVIDFPRNGAFIFVWEYLHPSRRQLVRTPPRPPRFSLSEGRGVRKTCDGPSGGFYFKQAGRVFQVEVYLGPGTRPALRARVASTLDGLQVARARQIE